MLTREIMGWFALAILWVNTLLIAAAAVKDLAALLRRRARLGGQRGQDLAPGYGLLEGRVTRGEGPEGALACHRVEQVGRSAGDSEKERAILFGDRTAAGEVFGGAIAVEGGGAEVVIAPATERTEVWIAQAALIEAGACPSADAFDAAYADARRARGFTRTVEAALRAGQKVWIAGEIGRKGRDGAAVVTASRDRGILVSTLDPRKLLGRKIALSIAAIAGILAGAAGVTALALTPPYFGPISTAGGALGLIYFLLVQPAGTALREAVLLPPEAFVRGAWTRAESAAGEPSLTSAASGSAQR